MTWQKIVARLEVEAGRVISKHTSTPEDYAAARAITLIAAAKRLRQAVEAGRIDVALDEFVNVSDAHDMMLLADLSPTFAANMMLLALRAPAWDLSNAMYQNLERGSTSQIAAIAGGETKAISKEIIASWQADYEDQLVKNPRLSKTDAAKAICREFDYSKPEDPKPGTIRQKLKKPKHVVAIRGQISA